MINLKNRKGVDISSNNGKISIEKIEDNKQIADIVNKKEDT